MWPAPRWLEPVAPHPNPRRLLPTAGKQGGYSTHARRTCSRSGGKTHLDTNTVGPGTTKSRVSPAPSAPQTRCPSASPTRASGRPAPSASGLAGFLTGTRRGPARHGPGRAVNSPRPPAPRERLRAEGRPLPGRSAVPTSPRDPASAVPTFPRETSGPAQLLTRQRDSQFSEPSAYSPAPSRPPSLAK